VCLTTVISSFCLPQCVFEILFTITHLFAVYEILTRHNKTVSRIFVLLSDTFTCYTIYKQYVAIKL